MKPLIKEINGTKPQFGEDCYISENATIIGDVICGDRCSFWFNSVTRGDVHYIKMGMKSTYKTVPLFTVHTKKVLPILVIKLP